MEGPSSRGLWLSIASAATARPGWTLVLIALLTGLLGSGLGELDLRTDGASIRPAGNPVVERTEADRRTFAERDQVILLLASRPGGPRVDSRAGLARLKELHTSLGAVPGVDVDGLRSAASLLDVRPGAPLQSIPSFLDRIPDEDSELRAMVARLRAFPLTNGLFLSADGTAAALYVPLDGDLSRSDFVASIEAWVAARDTRDFDLGLTGPLAAEVLLGRSVLRDLAWLTPAMVGAMAILLFLCLRTAGGVAIPLVETGVVLVWTLGAMGHFGAPVTLVTTVLPVVLVTLAVTDEIHLIERLQAHLRSGAQSGARAALDAALRDVGRPIVLTSLTTAAGFLSFLTASVAPIRDFGLFAALGILAAMLLTFTLVPALVVSLPVAWFEERHARRRRSPRSIPLEALATRGGAWGPVLALLLVLAAVPGLRRLHVQDAWIENFDPDSHLVHTQQRYEQSFWGSYSFDIVLAADEEFFLQRSAGLQLVEGIRDVARAGPHVEGSASHLLLFEQAAMATEVGGAISSQPENVLFSLALVVRSLASRIDLAQYLSADATRARIRLFVDSASYERGRELEAYLEREVPQLIEARAPRVRHHFSGILPVAVEVVASVVTNQMRSLGAAFLGLAVVLLVALRRLRLVAITLAPLAVALPILFGGMGLAGLPLGVATSMFAPLAVGAGVDFAVHFVHAYRRERSAGLDHEPGVTATLASAGRAIRWNSAVLVFGFLVLGASALPPNRSLGLLLSASIFVCYAATLLLLPALLRTASTAPAASA